MFQKLANPSPVSPEGEKLIPPETKVDLLWKINTTIMRPAPFPFGKGRGIAQPSRRKIVTIKGDVIISDFFSCHANVNDFVCQMVRGERGS